MDSLEDENLMILIKDHETVSLCSKFVNPETKQRSYYCDATLNADLQKPFRFGDFMHQEAFIIALQSKFKWVGDFNKVLAFVSALSVNKQLTSDDDGVSQRAVLSKGISGAMKEEAVVPIKPTLVPYRTFSEVEQPESKFIFRLKAYDDGVPLCALFEADGGAWQNKAIQNIKEWLGESIPDVLVLA